MRVSVWVVVFKIRWVLGWWLSLLLQSKTKHISIKYHMLREKFVDKEIKLEYVNKKEKIVDIFTKPLPKETFEYLQGMLGVMPFLHQSRRCNSALVKCNEAPLFVWTKF